MDKSTPSPLPCKSMCPCLSGWQWRWPCPMEQRRSRKGLHVYVEWHPRILSVRNVCCEFGEFNINHLLRDIHRPGHGHNIRRDITFLISGTFPAHPVQHSPGWVFRCQQIPSWWFRKLKYAIWNVVHKLRKFIRTNKSCNKLYYHRFFCKLLTLHTVCN